MAGYTWRLKTAWSCLGLAVKSRTRWAISIILSPVCLCLCLPADPSRHFRGDDKITVVSTVHVSGYNGMSPTLHVVLGTYHYILPQYHIIIITLNVGSRKTQHILYLCMQTSTCPITAYSTTEMSGSVRRHLSSHMQLCSGSFYLM